MRNMIRAAICGFLLGIATLHAATSLRSVGAARYNHGRSPFRCVITPPIEGGPES
jgi:hypothetical protein